MVAPQQSNPIRPEFELGGLGRDTEAREQAPYERRVRLFVRLHGRRMLDQESGFRACQARAQPREGQISSRIQFPLDLRAHGCEKSVQYPSVPYVVCHYSYIITIIHARQSPG